MLSVWEGVKPTVESLLALNEAIRAFEPCVKDRSEGQRFDRFP